MSVLDVTKNRYVDQVRDKKKKEKKIDHPKTKDKRYFSKIRAAIKRSQK